MEESTKKAVMIVIVVVCLVAAGTIFFSTRSRTGGGLDKLPDEMMTWLLCRNPDCEASYQMGLKVYFKEIEANVDPGSMAVPALTCEKCGEPSGYRAVKCEKCESTFERGTMGAQEFADRCPDCGYSAIEEGRKRRAAERAQDR